jgi:hypothetical protein
MLLSLCPVGCLSLEKPTGQRLSNVRKQQKKSIWPILFLYYEESLVSSNLNSNLLMFHGAHPNLEPSEYKFYSRNQFTVLPHIVSALE